MGWEIERMRRRPFCRAGICSPGFASQWSWEWILVMHGGWGGHGGLGCDAPGGNLGFSMELRLRDFETSFHFYDGCHTCVQAQNCRSFALELRR